MSGPGDRAQRRIRDQLPAGAREVLERGLPPADLHSLLLAVARDRAGRVSPADLLRRWQDDRFVQPSDVDARALSSLESRLWQLLPTSVEGVELSPVTPLGTSAALASVSQNRIVSTMRGTEVVSDSTTALAVEASLRRRRQPREGEVHLAAAQRQVRAQQFGAGERAHFRLLSLVSTARDSGTARTESRLLRTHIRYWLDVLLDLVPDAGPRVEITAWPEGRAAGPILQELRGWADDEGLARWVVEIPSRTQARGYYDGIALRLTARDGAVDLGDGGLTRWTAALLADAKERCLVSCISTERLLALLGPTTDGPHGGGTGS